MSPIIFQRTEYQTCRQDQLIRRKNEQTDPPGSFLPGTRIFTDCVDRLRTSVIDRRREEIIHHYRKCGGKEEIPSAQQIQQPESGKVQRRKKDRHAISSSVCSTAKIKKILFVRQ